ncbi:hypothetical protein LOZ58_003580 [Ophidiomyces ophidiicola]|nr:hypothetical protein LOZ65_001301 [Ophidiomyces ophidiicola]KAI1961092.1 hypothetical protein LOZ58_003580 [Ophidiomyces ophidiicola]
MFSNFYHTPRVTNSPSLSTSQERKATMNVIAFGATALITKTGRGSVMKQAAEESRHEVLFERKIYELLGPHPRIARYIGPVVHTVELEFYENGCIDQLKMKRPEFEVPYLRWAEQIAEGLVFLHSNNVVHCDLRSANILVTDSLDLVLADFASSCLNGERVSYITNKTRYRPGSCEFPYDYSFTIQDDFFAFGSVLYNLITSKDPYADLEDHEVIKLYNSGIFPDVSELPMSTIMSKCWCGEYSSATQLLEDIR